MMKQRDFDRARESWLTKKPLDAGKVIFETLPNNQRPLWAAGLLRGVISDFESKPILVELVDLAEDASRWSEARKIFDRLREESLKESSLLLGLAENVAKVIYNASGGPAPYDSNSGWRVAGNVAEIIKEYPHLEERLTFDLFGGRSIK